MLNFTTEILENLKNFKNLESIENEIEMLVIARYLHIRGFEYRENIFDSHINYIELRIPNKKPVGKILKNDKGIVIEFNYPLIRTLSKAFELRYKNHFSWKEICGYIFEMCYIVGFMPSQVEINDYQIFLHKRPQT